jgi:hypothetical protein
VLEACRKLKAVRSQGVRNPRMVKRRNSPFASHNRFLKKKVPADYAPEIMEPPEPKPGGQPMRPHLMRRHGHAGI